MPALLLSLLFACGDGGGGNDFGDAGAGTTDMGSPADGGPTGTDMGASPLTCDPVADTGCSLTEICRVTPAFDDGVCIVPAGERGAGESCDATAQDCGGGLICGALPGAEADSCVRLCEVDGDRGCGQDAFCQPLQAGDRFGVCIDSCDIFDPSSCPAGQACFDTGGPARQCLPAGNGGDGDPCVAADECQAGFSCVGGNDATCEPICDPNAPDPDADCPGMMEICLPLVDQDGEPLDFGFCDVVPECSLFDTGTCPEGDACGLTGTFDYPVCVAAGTGDEGQLCGGGAGCMPGLICVGPAGEATCRRPCNMFNMCEAGFACATLGEPFDEFGACLPMM